MENLQGWEALCQQRTATQWEEDSARAAISAAIVAGLEPTGAAIDRWRRACERSIAVNARMSGHVHAASMTHLAALGEFCPGVARAPVREVDRVGRRLVGEEPLTPSL